MPRDSLVSDELVHEFQTKGYVHIPDVLDERDVASLEPLYDRFMRGELAEAMGRDFCDMSGPYDREFDDFALVNAMLPRVYAPELQGNIFERVAASIAAQLIGGDIALDYDQFLGKRPNKAGARFAWHQDQGYWPIGTPDTRTATCSLAIDDSIRANGCIKFLPGSGANEDLRPHRSAGSTRDDAHTLIADVDDDETVEHVQVKRGGITVHDEWVVHGSGGNGSNGWRRTYVVAFRSRATVEYERSIGFTHSHNDRVNWKTMLGDLREG